MTAEPFVTTDAVAEYLGVPETWIYARAAELALPRYKLGNRYRYRLSEVAAWVERQGASIGAEQ